MLIALLGALHLIAVPCAMAAVDHVPACGHCAGMTDPEPCLSAGGSMSPEQPGPLADEPRLPPRPSRSWLVVPATLNPAKLAVGPGREVAAQTGRRTGDPPCRLRFGNLRI